MGRDGNKSQVLARRHTAFTKLALTRGHDALRFDSKLGNINYKGLHATEMCIFEICGASAKGGLLLGGNHDGAIQTTSPLSLLQVHQMPLQMLRNPIASALARTSKKGFYKQRLHIVWHRIKSPSIITNCFLYAAKRHRLHVAPSYTLERSRLAWSSGKSIWEKTASTTIFLHPCRPLRIPLQHIRPHALIHGLYTQGS